MVATLINLPYLNCLTMKYTDDVKKFKYSECTDHLDPDDGLLYRVLRVEERNYSGQGRFVVCYRAHVYPDGKICMKTSKEAIHA